MEPDAWVPQGTNGLSDLPSFKPVGAPCAGETPSRRALSSEDSLSQGVGGAWCERRVGTRRFMADKNPPFLPPIFFG